MMTRYYVGCFLILIFIGVIVIMLGAAFLIIVMATK